MTKYDLAWTLVDWVVSNAGFQVLLLQQTEDDLYVALVPLADRVAVEAFEFAMKDHPGIKVERLGYERENRVEIYIRRIAKPYIVWGGADKGSDL